MTSSGSKYISLMIMIHHCKQRLCRRVLVKLTTEFPWSDLIQQATVLPAAAGHIYAYSQTIASALENC